MPANIVNPSEQVPEAVARREKEINMEYRNNALLKETRSQAMWSFLAQIEQMYWIRFLKQTPDLSMFPDAAVNLSKWPMRWLWNDVQSDGSVDTRYRNDRVTSANELAILGHKYTQYEAVFTLARRGRHQLHLKGNRITASRQDSHCAQRDAYDRVVDYNEQSSNDPVSLSELARPVTTLHAHGFRYQVRERLYRRALRDLAIPFSRRFRLPVEWSIGDHTIGEYRTVLEFLFVLSVLHICARGTAITRGCEDLGYANALVIMGRQRLIRLATQLTDLTPQVTESIVGLLTYGGFGMNQPDIALQPLVPFWSDQIGWSPYLVSQSAMERNLVALLTRSPSTRADYNAHNAHHEVILRDELIIAFKGQGFRCWHGHISNWQDAEEIDLAVVDDRTRQVLLLELKAFIGPADPIEVYYKSRALEKGLSQIQRRRVMAETRSGDFHKVLRTNDEYRFAFAVVSRTSAGNGLVCSADVPVVRSSDLLRRVGEADGLEAICRWLTEFEYLPVHGVDYEEVPESVQIGRTVLAWYRVNIAPGSLEESQDFGRSADRGRSRK